MKKTTKYPYAKIVINQAVLKYTFHIILRK